MTLPVRILDRIEAGDCWEWKGRIAPDGYGHVWSEGATRVAHRVVYGALVGPIPPGMTLDHLCRNRACVNPDHLEEVTNRENILRGYGAGAVNARKSVCIHGHPFNTTRPDGRACLACGREKVRRYHLRVKGAKG